MKAAWRHRPCRDFAPAGDLLFAPPKSRQKALPCKTAPAGFPALLESQGRAELASLRSAQTSVASQFLKRAAHAPWDSSITGGFKGEAPNSPPQQPTAKPASRLSPAVRYAPFSTAEKRKPRSPRAKLASSTDSRRLFEQSVATRVRRGASGLSLLGDPSEARAVRSGGAFCLLFGGPKSRSPAGANSRLGLAAKPHRPEQSQ